MEGTEEVAKSAPQEGEVTPHQHTTPEELDAHRIAGRAAFDTALLKLIEARQALGAPSCKSMAPRLPSALYRP